MLKFKAIKKKSFSRIKHMLDWDDAQALCLTTDIARLTFWMKLKYDEKTAYEYKKAENH